MPPLVTTAVPGTYGLNDRPLLHLPLPLLHHCFSLHTISTMNNTWSYTLFGITAYPRYSSSIYIITFLYVFAIRHRAASMSTSFTHKRLAKNKENLPKSNKKACKFVVPLILLVVRLRATPRYGIYTYAHPRSSTALAGFCSPP